MNAADKNIEPATHIQFLTG